MTKLSLISIILFSLTAVFAGEHETQCLTKDNIESKTVALTYEYNYKDPGDAVKEGQKKVDALKKILKPYLTCKNYYSDATIRLVKCPKNMKSMGENVTYYTACNDFKSNYYSFSGSINFSVIKNIEEKKFSQILTELYKKKLITSFRTSNNINTKY